MLAVALSSRHPFIYTLNLTDRDSGWVDSCAIMGKGQLERLLAYPSAHTLKRQALLRLRQQLGPCELSTAIDQQLQHIGSLANDHHSPRPSKRTTHDALSREGPTRPAKRHTR